MIKIGRLNTCDLSLPDISISRILCCVYVEGGQLFWKIILNMVLKY
jgi:pSer/pThr/pTyr-binding forkhead associated (FHA) protein